MFQAPCTRDSDANWWWANEERQMTFRDPARWPIVHLPWVGGDRGTLNGYVQGNSPRTRCPTLGKALVTYQFIVGRNHESLAEQNFLKLMEKLGDMQGSRGNLRVGILTIAARSIQLMVTHAGHVRLKRIIGVW